MNACMKSGTTLFLSFVAISLLYGEEITIDKDSPKSFYGKYISGSSFRVNGNNNIITWNGIPKDIRRSIDIIAGYSTTADVSGNTLNFNGDSTLLISYIYGGDSKTGVAKNNTLNIKRGDISRNVVGGNGRLGAINNLVAISGGNLANGSYIQGGKSLPGKASNNTVTITGGLFGENHSIYGGHSKQGEAGNNTVTIYGGEFKQSGSIHGGYSETGKVVSNTVNIDGGNFEGSVIYGGESFSNSATHNTVNLNVNNLVLSSIIGGNISSSASRDAFTGNTLNVRGKNITASRVKNFEFLNFYIPVGFMPATDKMLTLNTAPDLSRSKVGVAMMHGGVLNNGDNITLIEAMNGDIKYPTDMTNQTGQLQTGISAKYKFTLKADDTKKKLFAIVGVPTKLKNLTVNTDTPQAEYEIYDTSTIGGKEFSLNGSKNSLTWNGTPNYANENTDIKAGYSDTEDVNENTFNFNGNDSTHITHIYAGHSNKRNAINNKLYITGGKILAGAYGALADLDAKNNHVYITGGEFDNSRSTIYGGYSSNNGEASANSITIAGWESSNNSKNVDIVGGYSENGKAINNTVNLKADGIILGGIYGGEVPPGSMEENLIGNTLNVRGKNITAAAIENFEKLNFYIPVGFMPATDKMLRLTEAPDLTNSKIGVAMMKGGVLNNGDEVTLIYSDAGIIYPTKENMKNHKNQIQAGISAKYDFTLKEDSEKKRLLAKVVNEETHPDNKPEIEKPKENIPETNRPHLLPYPKNVIETTIGELGMLSSSLDMISSMSLQTDSNGAFASTSASNTRLKSGSHVDVKSFNAAAGVAKEFEGNTVGMFVEFGGGKYDSFNDFDKIDVRGNGKFKYIGLGIATKFSLANSFYLSSSFKAGKIKSDYESDMPAVTTPKYEAKRSYYGMHLGLGKMIDISDISNIDIYSKVFFNKLGEKEIEVDIVGDRILLKPAKSLSAKIGARYNHTINERFDLYTGTSYEREFKGEAKGYNLTHNVDIDSPSIKGSTYNAEIGAKLNSANNLTLDFNLQGMTGKKRGVNGGIGVQWRF